MEFAEFIQDIEHKVEYEKGDLFRKFKEEYPDYENVRQNTFTLWIKRYVQLNELKMDLRKSGSKRYIRLISKNG